MSEKIDQTLKKIAAGTPNGKTTTPAEGSAEAGSGQPPRQPHTLPGRPDCPICGGLGYLRLDVPVGHPEFGKLQPCSCRYADIRQQVSQRLYALSNLDELSHLTFENFMPRGRVGLWPQQADSLERAYNNARQFARSLDGWLLLQGGFGCGKTHLAAAVANYAVSMGVPTLFITVPDLLDSLRFSYDDPEATFEDRFNEIRKASLLVMDDFGTQNATPWAQEKLFQIINFRYVNRLPLVVTTNLPLQDIEERIRSRLLDPDLVTRENIQAPDFRNPAMDLGHPDLSSLQLLHGLTFANFDMRAKEGLKAEDLMSLEKAFNAARSFAENPQGWLIFTGPYGCGKTHLGAAIGNYRKDLGDPPLLIAVPDLLDHLRAAFSPNSTVSLDRRFEEVRTSSLLILDDLGTQNATPWAREKLYQLFNYRYNAEMPTVITTAGYKEDMDQRLLSRMQDNRLCVTCAITVPSYRGASRSPLPGTRRGRPRGA